MARQNVPGYIFPNVPDGWSRDGKNFALGIQRLFDQLFAGLRTTQESRALIDYTAMMGDIEIPSDTSQKAPKVGAYYKRRLWNVRMVWDAVGKQWITATEYENIVGVPYPVNRPQ